MSLAIPPSFLRSFSRSTLATVESSMDKLRVADVVFFRNAHAGTVTESGRRSYTAFLVVGATRKFESASCTCSPTMKPEDLCRHLAVLTHRIVDEEGTFPGERFERSIWCEIGKLLLERHGAAANVDASETVLRIASDAEVFTMRFEESAKIALRADDFREQRLRKLSMSAQEIELAKRGSRSQRQLWEDSVWFDLARTLFRNAKRFGPPTLVRRDGEFRLETNEGAAAFSLALPARAVGALVEQEGLATRGGFAIVENGAFASVSMSLAANGDLHFDPMLVFDCAAPRVIVRRATAAQYGRYFLLEKAEGLESPSSTASFVSLREAPPLFAETTPGEQASLFASSSSRRVSADRPSTIAAPDVFRFLERHREEIGAMPAELVPPALRDIVPLRSADEAIFDFASADPIELAITYRGRGASFPWHEVHAARRGGLSAICRDSVWLQTTSPEFSWMDATEVSEERVRVTPLEYLRLRALTRVPVVCRGDARGIELFNRFESLRASSSAPTLADLGLDLYGYQQTGYQWLWFLQENSFGGLLCDDMGLGKTHQAIALMRACTLRDPGASMLVVCPTSLIDHWREKLARYLPAVPATIHYGSDRAGAAGAQLVVTSYGLLRNDIEQFASRRFDLVILDEMQTIKNRATATHQAVARVPRGVAIGLTGTPVENRVEELRSLLDFVMPGYLPGETEFRRVYADPIEQHRDRVARERLHRLVNPFILRRTKEQVLDQLPEKIVDKRYCEMTDPQRDLYRALVASKGRLLREQLKGERVPYIHIFALLNHLKSICNHPATFDAEYAEVASGKWNLFCELMEESMQSGLKVVVFSQYVRMLKRIESWLDGQSIGWATIKGDTRDRGKMIERFRRDDDCRVFTASLRAGGLGIDLTAASVVIHYDRWWNQAREDQATDRVHRLGQNKGVQVLKLITRGTLEEKIDAMIERKGALADGVVKEDDATLVKQFSREELEELLA